MSPLSVQGPQFRGLVNVEPKTHEFAPIPSLSLIIPLAEDLEAYVVELSDDRFQFRRGEEGRLAENLAGLQTSLMERGVWKIAELFGAAYKSLFNSVQSIPVETTSMGDALELGDQVKVEEALEQPLSGIKSAPFQQILQFAQSPSVRLLAEECQDLAQVVDWIKKNSSKAFKEPLTIEPFSPRYFE